MFLNEITGYLKIGALLLLAISIFGFNDVLAVADSTNINLQVTGLCNFNNICEPELGETPESCPSDCQPASVTSGGADEPFIFQIKDVIFGNTTVNSADVSWLTTKFSTCQFFWGKTSEYSQEIISETKYSARHNINLRSLDFSSKYYFKIECVSQNQETADFTGEFYTLTPINNVSGFTAVGSENKVSLKWVNPADEAFNGVKIIKSTSFFPLNIRFGAVVYEGMADSFEDVNVENGKIYFYTIFTKDKNNNYSSGAIAFAMPFKEGKEAPIIPPISPAQPPAAKTLTIGDFKFSSKGGLEVNNGLIEVIKGESLNISAECDKISEFKTVLVSLEDQDKTSSFIIKKDEAGDSCTVSFLLPENSGIYKLKILAVNSKNEIAEQIDAQLKVLEKKSKTAWFQSIFAISIYLLALAAVFLIILRGGWGKKKPAIKLGF